MPLSLSCAARCVLSPSDRAQHARASRNGGGGGAKETRGELDCRRGRAVGCSCGECK